MRKWKIRMKEKKTKKGGKRGMKCQANPLAGKGSVELKFILRVDEDRWVVLKPTVHCDLITDGYKRVTGFANEGFSLQN